MWHAFGTELPDGKHHQNSEHPWKYQSGDGAGQLPSERLWGVEPDQPFSLSLQNRNTSTSKIANTARKHNMTIKINIGKKDNNHPKDIILAFPTNEA